MLTAAPRKEAAETVIPTLQPLTPCDTTWGQRWARASPSAILSWIHPGIVALSQTKGRMSKVEAKAALPGSAAKMVSFSCKVGAQKNEQNEHKGGLQNRTGSGTGNRD